MVARLAPSSSWVREMAHRTDIYSLLKEIFLLLDDGDRRLFDCFGLTVPRYYVLFHLGAEPGISVSQLSRLMFCDKSNITRLIQGLQSEGLVTRRPHESDGRVLRLFLTPQGEALRSEVATAHDACNRRRIGQELTEREQGELLSYLHALQVGLKRNLATETF